MKLELKHLAPYLPYKLMINCDFKDGDIMVYELEFLGDEDAYLDGCDWSYKTNTDFKPILRPISDLTRDEYFKLSGKSDKKKFGYWYVKKNNTQEEGIYFEGYSSRRISLRRIDLIPYYAVKFLFSNHFDVFGLIEKGLAIDINTLNQ